MYLVFGFEFDGGFGIFFWVRGREGRGLFVC